MARKEINKIVNERDNGQCQALRIDEETGEVGLCGQAENLQVSAIIPPKYLKYLIACQQYLIAASESELKYLLAADNVDMLLDGDLLKLIEDLLLLEKISHDPDNYVLLCEQCAHDRYPFIGRIKANGITSYRGLVTTLLLLGIYYHDNSQDNHLAQQVERNKHSLVQKKLVQKRLLGVISSRQV